MSVNDKMTAIADAIRAKTGGTEKLSLDDMPAAIESIETGGGGGEEWTHYATTLYQLFRKAAFPDGYELVINVPNMTAVADCGQIIAEATGLRKLTVKCGNADIVLKSYFAFGSCQSVEEIDLSQFCNTEVVKIAKTNYAFYGAYKLRAIHGILDFSACTEFAQVFTSCARLEEVRIASGSLKVSCTFSSCPMLSDGSIQSIIEGLADLTGGTAQTLTLASVVGAKLTDAQKAAAAAKNWTIAY